MANPLTVNYVLATADADGIAQSQKPLAAGALTLNGALVSGGVATLDTQRRVVIGSDADDSGRTFTITGTNGAGNPITESLDGPTAADDVYTVLDYLTVTSVTIDAAAAGNLTVGTNGIGSTAWINTNFMDWIWCLAIACSCDGSSNYTVEHTYDDITQIQTNLPYGWAITPASNVPPKAWENPVIANVTGNNEVRYQDWPIQAFRLRINSGTDPVQMQAIQTGRGSGG